MDYIRRRARRALPVVAIMLVGCGGARPTGGTVAAPNLVPVAVRVAQRGATIEMVVTAFDSVREIHPSLNFYSNIVAGDVELRDGAGRVVARQEGPMRFAMRPVDDGTERVRNVVEGRFALRVPDSIGASFDGTARVRLRDRAEHVVCDTTMPARFDRDQMPALALRLSIEPAPNGGYRLGMTVRRVRVRADEYTPSTLSHDYVVTTLDGRTIWQMSYGGMYGQVLMPVKPAEVGAEYSYTDQWDGLGNVAPGRVPTGEYWLIGVVPSRPDSVRDSIPFRVQ